MSKDVEIVQLIHTRIKTTGEGKAPDDPFRVVEQWWTMGGDLVFERDAWKMRYALKAQGEQVQEERN